MTHAEISLALNALRPGAEWSFSGDNYAGLVWLDNTTLPPSQPELESWIESTRLQRAKTAAKARIDREAEEARLRYITAGAGQALEYQEAAEEAARYVATGGAGAYPMLQASVDAGEAADLASASALISAHENAWAMVGSTIRRLRLTAKRAVDAATTVEQVQAAALVTFP